MNLKPQSTREWVVIIVGGVGLVLFLLWLFVIDPGQTKLKKDRTAITDLNSKLKVARAKAQRKAELDSQSLKMRATYSNILGRIADVRMPADINDIMLLEFNNIDRVYQSSIKQAQYGRVQTNGMHKTLKLTLPNVECNWKSLVAALYLIENSGQLVGFDSLSVEAKSEGDKREAKERAQIIVSSFIFPDKGARDWSKPDYIKMAEQAGRDIFRVPECMIPPPPTNTSKPLRDPKQLPPWANLLQISGITTFGGKPVCIIKTKVDRKEFRFYEGATISNTPGATVKIIAINVSSFDPSVTFQDSTGPFTLYLRSGWRVEDQANKRKGQIAGSGSVPTGGIGGPGEAAPAGGQLVADLSGPPLSQERMASNANPPGKPDASTNGVPSPTVPNNYEQPLGSFSESQLKAGLIVILVDQYVQRRYGLKTDKGMLVYKIQKLGPADKAGILQRDVITSIGGIEVVDKETFNYGLNKGYIANKQAIAVSVNRSNEAKSFSIEMK